MAQASSFVELPISPDVVWQLIGGFDSLPDWLPYIPKSEVSEGGRVRSLANPSGEAIIERLMAFDEKARSYSYAILQAPFPVTNYYSTLQVKDAGGGKASRVEWSGSFTPAGVSDAEATKLFQGIYDDGLKALADGFNNRR
ncbi:SRPBCC family protein [Pseudomonas sp. NPDC090202]|uniref:SRPBCC family protein n=1 Tax=unclassified Pseudomonas TaxID=196821 RepID=UPI003826E9FD